MTPKHGVASLATSIAGRCARQRSLEARRRNGKGRAPASTLDAFAAPRGRASETGFWRTRYAALVRFVIPLLFGGLLHLGCSSDGARRGSPDAGAGGVS